MRKILLIKLYNLEKVKIGITQHCTPDRIYTGILLHARWKPEKA